MAGKSDYLEDKIIEHVLRNVDYTSPATVYIALYTTAPSDAGGGTQVAGGSYARQSVAFDAPSPAGSVENSAQITFPVASADWGTITHWGIFDNVAGGNLLYWAGLTNPKTILTGDQLKFGAGSIVVTED